MMKITAMRTFLFEIQSLVDRLAKSLQVFTGDGRATSSQDYDETRKIAIIDSNLEKYRKPNSTKTGRD